LKRQECNRRSFARQAALNHRHSDHCGAQRRVGRAISADEETPDCAEVPQDGVILTVAMRLSKLPVLKTNESAAAGNGITAAANASAAIPVRALTPPVDKTWGQRQLRSKYLFAASATR